MATPAPQPFRDWLQAQLELRGIVGVVEAGRVLGISQSMMSRYLAGQDRPARKNVIHIANGLGLPVAAVQDAVDADPGRANPLDDIRQLLVGLAEQLAAGPLEVAHAGPVPAATRMIEASGPFPDAAGPMVPVIVRAPHPLAMAHNADRAVAWVVATTAPQPGWWVHVGTADPPDPADLKEWAPGDRVTGVVAIVQVVPRARA